MTGGLLSSRPNSSKGGKSTSETRQAKLADCVELLSGFAFKSQQFTDDPNDVALVKGENVSQGHVLWDISKRWPLADWEKFEKFQLAVGDVVIAMDRPWVPAGLKWCLIRDHDPKALLVQRCCRLRANPSLMDQTFLRCVIGGPGFESYIKPITTGVNIPHISGRQILDYTFNLPDLPTQRKIAGILSAYDDLIENNLRRIKILEEMAQSLYREWFVHFRFPGHESAKFVDSELGRIPKGWEVKTLDELTEVILDCRGKTPKKLGGDWSDEGIVALSALNVKTGHLIKMDQAKTLSEALYSKWMKTPLKRHDVLLTSEAPLGECYLLPDDTPYCLSQRLFALRAIPEMISPVLLFYSLISEQGQTRLQNRATGTTVRGIRQSALREVEILVPNQKIRELAGAFFEGTAAQLANLHRRNQNLHCTRDLLLPKLLNQNAQTLDHRD